MQFHSLVFLKVPIDFAALEELIKDSSQYGSCGQVLLGNMYATYKKNRDI